MKKLFKAMKNWRSITWGQSQEIKLHSITIFPRTLPSVLFFIERISSRGGSRRNRNPHTRFEPVTCQFEVRESNHFVCDTRYILCHKIEQKEDLTVRFCMCHAIKHTYKLIQCLLVMPPLIARHSRSYLFFITRDSRPRTCKRQSR